MSGPLDIVICPACGARLKKRNGGYCSSASLLYVRQCGARTGCGFTMESGNILTLGQFIAEKTWDMGVCADFVRAVFGAGFSAGEDWQRRSAGSADHRAPTP